MRSHPDEKVPRFSSAGARFQHSGGSIQLRKRRTSMTVREMMALNEANWVDTALNIPVTSVPGTQVPVTQVPVTQVLVTQVLVTPVPVTAVPVTPVPVTAVSVTAVSVTQAPVTPVPVSLFRADPTPATITDDSTVSSGDNIDSSFFMKLQPCILRCTSDFTQEALTWELQGRDPVHDAFYYQASEIVADAKSLGAEVVRESHILGHDDAPLQMSCSTIPYEMSDGATSDLSQPSKKTGATIDHSTQESLTFGLTSNLTEDEALSPNTRQNIVNMSVQNVIKDSLEKSFKDVIKTKILKNLLNETTQQGIPSAPQTRTFPDELQVRRDMTAYDGNHLKVSATDSDVDTPLIQVVKQTAQQSMSENETTTSASKEVFPVWQTNEIVTMSVEDMTESTETTAECIQSVSVETSESPDGEVSKQSNPESDQTTMVMVALPLEKSLHWQTPETMECISKEVEEVLPVLTAFHPKTLSPTQETRVPEENINSCTNQAVDMPILTAYPPMPQLPTPETCLPKKNVISCTNEAVIKEVIAVSQRAGYLTPELPHTKFSQEHSRFSQEPTWSSQEAILTTSISPSHQTCSETFVSKAASNPFFTDKRKLLDKNNNFGEPPPKQFRLNSRVAGSSPSHPVLLQKLTSPKPPPLLQGQPQGATPPILPQFVQQEDTLPVLRSKLQPGDGFSNTVSSPPSYHAACASWLNASNPNMSFPRVPISQCQPPEAYRPLSDRQSHQVNNSAYTLPKYPSWTRHTPIMSTYPQIPGESSVFPDLANRAVGSQPGNPQVMTNTQRLISTGSLRYTDMHLPPYNFSVPSNVYPQQRPTLPPPSYYSSLRPPIKELQYPASNSSSNYHPDKFGTSVDRDEILKCIRRPPPYQARQVHPTRKDPHTITNLPRRAPTDLDPRRTDRVQQLSPHAALIPAPNRETILDKRQANSLENYKKVSCLNCDVTIPPDDWNRVLMSDVVAVIENAIDLSLPQTAGKPPIILCKFCENVMHKICSSRQALFRAKTKFSSYTSPEGFLYTKKMCSTIEHFFCVNCVNCNVLVTVTPKKRLLFSKNSEQWVVANIIQEEFNIALAPDKQNRKLYLCLGCYKRVKQVRSAQVSMALAMKDFNLRMSPTSDMFKFNQRFERAGSLT
ncbi:mucin-17-like [Asterias rubens]|uniref:mucin-17-like n=1 Tax=Asterias rubens TaxID=7604 RepID=UPI0014556B68|nr:mucin-17-like [Asterias rubens]